MTTPKEPGTWDTETGLPNDIDAWISNARFGVKDEYAQVVQASGGEGLMLLFDLIDVGGELVGNQGYSIGTGWIPSDDGKSISHPKRKNVVTNTMYGQLQNRVRKDLGVKMEERGLPTDARCWEGLGFHWMQQEHDTVSGEKKTGIMPVMVLAARPAGAPAPAVAPTGAPAATAVVGISTELELQLKTLAQSNDVKAFQLAAMKVADVVANDSLMASVLDESPAGFWATHQ